MSDTRDIIIAQVREIMELKQRVEILDQHNKTQKEENKELLNKIEILEQKNEDSEQRDQGADVGREKEGEDEEGEVPQEQPREEAPRREMGLWDEDDEDSVEAVVRPWVITTAPLCRVTGPLLQRRIFSLGGYPPIPLPAPPSSTPPLVAATPLVPTAPVAATPFQAQQNPFPNPLPTVSISHSVTQVLGPHVVTQYQPHPVNLSASFQVAPSAPRATPGFGSGGVNRLSTNVLRRSILAARNQGTTHSSTSTVYVRPATVIRGPSSSTMSSVAEATASTSGNRCPVHTAGSSSVRPKKFMRVGAPPTNTTSLCSSGCNVPAATASYTNPSWATALGTANTAAPSTFLPRADSSVPINIPPTFCPQATTTSFVGARDSDITLWFACAEGRVDEVHQLINEGANINVKGYHSRTPLHCAAWNNNLTIATALITAGAPVDIRDDLMYTPVNLAAGYGHREVTSALLNVGAQLEMRNNYGDTPLLSASRNGYVECVELLLAAGAFPNAKNSYGKTPLHYASRRGDERCVQILMNAGADPTLMDMHGESAKDVAKNFDIFSLLS